MPHEFDKDYWERHWQERGVDAPGSTGGNHGSVGGGSVGGGSVGGGSMGGGSMGGGSMGGGSMRGNPPNPYLAGETSDLTPGTALDAGCGAGAEAIWLASHGWQVTAADISSEALTHADSRAGAKDVRWVEADLSTWTPGTRFDLVTTHYAHPAMPQLEFYDRIAGWVAPGGTLLIVGHLAVAGAAHGHGHDHHPPAEASATAATITARLAAPEWEIVTAAEHVRTLTGHGGGEVPLHDVVVRARRRG